MAKNLDELLKESKEMANKLDGADYGRGQMETIEATCDNLRLMCGLLYVMVADRLSDDEKSSVEDILDTQLS